MKIAEITKLEDLKIKIINSFPNFGYDFRACRNTGKSYRDLKPQNVLILKSRRLFAFCLTGVKYPFGDDYHHDANIVETKVDLFLLEDIAEARHLISFLLTPNPKLR
ncbi:hypothetical protein TorRG33x02_178800 [Trema orientale]|uniref:Uncharacterized protein n=1 Tax=Trema orientale TaxID=63057 RepID=A0A2P5EL94_TREOI|nr:hypothetical protein TorRG33x02_178800 [Trema orientale]